MPRRTRCIPLILAWLILLTGPHLLADTGTGAGQLRRLRATGLDAEQCFRVRDLFLQREDVKLYFTDGYLLFGQPFDGRRFAALFIATTSTDQGEILIIPPTEHERKSLARFTGQPILNEKFRSAMLLFTDDTDRVLQAALADATLSQPDPQTCPALASNWTPTMRNLFDALALRTLIDLNSYADENLGYFTAAIGGGPRGRFDVAVDPRFDESVSVGQVVWRDNARYHEVWCRFPVQRSREGNGYRIPPYAHLEDFEIETTLGADLQMQVVAKATLVAEHPQSRIAAFELSRRLRLTEVIADGAPVEFLQFEETGAGGVAQRQNDLIAIVLPHKPQAGARHRLEFHYEGRVIADAGDGVYYVGSRSSWYPQLNPGFTNFDLVFRYPDTLDLVATGEQLESSSEGGIRTTRFRTSSPIRLAGFNLGHYRRASKSVGPYLVEVCANEGLEISLRPRVEPTLWAPNPFPRPRRTVPGPAETMSTPPPVSPPRPAARLEEIVSHSAAAVEFFHERFGPLAVKNVVISPIPGGFGQGFPGLVYASTLSYFGARDAPLQGYSASQQLFFTNLLRTHEIAHQWWGNVVSSDAISEVWLTEALATYSALLFLENHLGKDARDRVLAEYRDHLLARNEAGDIVESAGPVVLGERLRSSFFPNAARVIMYEKGAWIMHMLRSMMGDTPFLAFLRRLCETYRLRMLTTADFQKEAVQFLPEDFPDPSLDNFFQQWVYGTGIPSIEVKWDVRGRAPAFRLTGRIIQDAVPESSSVLVPVQIHTLPGRSLTKWVMTEGKTTEFGVVLQNKPSRLEVDPTTSILLRPRS